MINFNGFEDKFLENIDRKIKKEKEDNLFDESLLRRLKERFEIRYGRTRPEIEDFDDIYEREEIINDIRYIEKIESNFESSNDPTLESKKLAGDVFEAIFIEEAMKSAWLGREVRVTPTSKYDDYVNKVDAVAEIKNEEGFQELGIAVDITFSKETTDIEKKLDIIKNHIDKNQAPALIKYFKDKDGRNKKIFVPKVIIGCNSDILRELIDLMNKKSSNNEIVWKKAEHDLNFHHFQTILLEEILIQVKAFGLYAHRNNQKRTGDSYFKAQKIIEGIIKTKALYNEQIKEDIVSKDIVSNTIKNWTSKNLR